MPYFSVSQSIEAEGCTMQLPQHANFAKQTLFNTEPTYKQWYQVACDAAKSST